VSTWTPISTQTLSSAAASVTFSGIPQTYTDLVLVIQGFNTTNAAAAKLQFNGDTGSNYSTTWLEGSGSGASSGRQSSDTSIFLYYNGGAATNGISNSIVNINNYSNATTNKTVLSKFGNIAQTGSYVGLWRNTAAVTSIVVNAITQNFQSGSTFTLYGIKAE
jgi:hypothetical protein